MESWIPPELKQSIYSMLITVLLAWLGRMMWHVRQVQKSLRRFWSWHLVWELMIAVSIGFVAEGVAEYFGFQGKAATALIIVVSYLGPGWVEAMVLRVIDGVLGRDR